MESAFSSNRGPGSVAAGQHSMSRKQRSIKELRSFVDTLQEIAKKWRSIVSGMDEAGMEILFVHGDATFNTYLPIIQDFTSKSLSEFEIQQRAFREGRKAAIQLRAEKYQESQRDAQAPAPTKARKRNPK